MPRLPRDDPRSSLRLAAVSCRVLGVLGVSSGICLATGLGLHVLRAVGGGPPTIAGILGRLVTFGGAGMAYLILAQHLGRRRRWGVVSALCLTAAALTGDLVGLVRMALLALGRPPGPPVWPSAYFPLGIYALIAIALGQLMYHLARSFQALELVPPDEGRGFDVLPLAVLPTEVPHADSASR